MISRQDNEELSTTKKYLYKSVKKAVAIIGTRPQFIKHFPLQMAGKGVLNLITVHTGQHFDHNMSDVFFEQFKMSAPNYVLNSGALGYGARVDDMKHDLEKILTNQRPDIVIVYGDTNSTLAGALAASALKIPVAHIEAGLRSYNLDMPEEFNRIMTDQVSEYLFVPCENSRQNLLKEGIIEGIHVVGDIMKDLLLNIMEKNLVQKNEEGQDYYYATLHRPYNVDHAIRLKYILNVLNTLDKLVIFAIHPRTRLAMNSYGLLETQFKNIHFINPQAYIENINYMANSSGGITDSGGMQKELYWLHKKCVTIRPETEWVETLEGNANMLLYEDLSSLQEILNHDNATYRSELYGDGRACLKILDILK